LVTFRQAQEGSGMRLDEEPPASSPAGDAPAPAEPTGLGQGLPDYAAALAALHRAFRAELYAAVGELPLPRGGCVLDSPCGDGFYSGALAEHLGAEGAVVAADANGDYLEQARQALPHPAGAAQVEFVLADAYRLPFRAESFDLAWCAQSMVSLDPVPALRELGRVVRPGGSVAVLENDDFHHVLLPWPVEVELAVQRAFVQSCRQRFGDARTLYRGRGLARTLLAAELQSWLRRTYAIDRQAPLGPADRAFFAGYFAYLRELAAPHLPEAEARTFADLLDERSGRYLLDQPDFEATYLFTVAVGRKNP
jgi:ubiquinone/menaquinone biosynthesis C-methylase UbiE